MINSIRRIGRASNQYVVSDMETDKKLFDIAYEKGELNFKDRGGKIRWSLQFNSTALIAHLEDNKRYKAYYEIYSYVSDFANLVCKVDYMIGNSELLGLKFIDNEIDELYIHRKSEKWFGVFNKDREYVAVINRTKDVNNTIRVSQLDDNYSEFFVVVAFVIESIWFDRKFDRLRIDKNVKFVNKSPKRPRMGSFGKIRKELSM